MPSDTESTGGVGDPIADLTPRDLADRILAGHPVSTAAHADVARAATAEPDPDGECRGCNEGLAGDEPSALCHDCAQVFSEVLGRRVLEIEAIRSYLPALHGLRLAAVARVEEHERRVGVNASGRHLRDDLRALDAVLGLFGEGALDKLGRLRR